MARRARARRVEEGHERTLLLHAPADRLPWNIAYRALLWLRLEWAENAMGNGHVDVNLTRFAGVLDVATEDEAYHVIASLCGTLLSDKEYPGRYFVPVVGVHDDGGDVVTVFLGGMFRMRTELPWTIADD